MFARLVGLLTFACLGACSTAPGSAIQDLFNPSKGQAALKSGLKQYEDGDYADASRNLSGALDQGLSNREQVDAHKHLAFIHCASNRPRQCREAFNKALAVDPALELAPAEA